MNTRVNALYENQNSKVFLNKYKTRSRNILEGILPTYTSYLKTIIESDMMHLIGEDFDDTSDNIITLSMCETINLFDNELKYSILNEELDEKTIIDYINEKMSKKKKAAIGAGALGAAGVGGAYAAGDKDKIGLVKDKVTGAVSGKREDTSFTDRVSSGASNIKSKLGEYKDAVVDKAGKAGKAAADMYADSSTGQKAAAAGALATGAGLAGYKGIKAIKNKMKKKNSDK